MNNKTRKNMNINKYTRKHKQKYNHKHCSPGKILRKAFVRRYTTAVREKGFSVHRANKTYRVFPKSGSTIIKATCVKERNEEDLIGPLKKGDLLKYGYSYRKSFDERHSALRKAEKKYGGLSLYRKLDAVAKLSKHTVPEASHIFSTDRDWVRKTFGPLKKK